MNNLLKLPKFEMHVHIEGTLSPEMIFEKAQKHNIKLRYKTIEELKASYKFTSLADFLVKYYENMQVLLTKQDFYDLAWGHIEKLVAQNVRYAEVFFDPQAHISRGVSFENIIDGLYEAFVDAESKLNFKGKIIMCFLKDEPAEDAENVLKLAIPAVKTKKIVAIGFDSNETKNWAQRFEKVVNQARDLGLRVVTHAAENKEDQSVFEVLDIVKPERIDHGLYTYKSGEVLKRIAQENIHLTLCPMPNILSKAWTNIEDYEIK